jgi:phosphoglycolate phosphatase
MPVNLVIFDLDGTLVDTRLDINIALNHALNTAGLPGISVEKTVGYVGEGIKKLVENVLADCGTHAASTMDLVLPVMDSFIEYYALHVSDNSRPYPGVLKTLDALHGLKKAVVTNKKDDLTMKLLDALGLSRRFDLVLGPQSAAERKPSPAPLLKAMNTLGCGPAETLMVGDSAFDMEAAERAGVKTVFAAYGYGGAETALRADYIIEADLFELLPILEALA